MHTLVEVEHGDLIASPALELLVEACQGRAQLSGMRIGRQRDFAAAYR